jgi:hypothetical protein
MSVERIVDDVFSLLPMERPPIEKKVDEFLHHYNPLTLYCRLKELGVDKRIAYDMISFYDRIIFIPFRKAIIPEVKV